MAVTRSLETSVLYLRSLGSSCENLEVPTFPAYSLMSYSYFTCRMPSQSHTHTQKSLSAHSQKVYRNTEQLQKEAGRCPAKFWTLLSDTPLVPGMSLFPFLSTVTRKVLTVHKSVLTTIIS